MPKEYIQQWCTKCYDCPNGKVSHEGSITCHDKLPNTTTTSTTTPTPATTTTTTRYLAPYTAATQATKQTTVESVISAKVQSMNLSNPIWIAVFVMAGLGVVVLGICIATLVFIFVKKKKARVDVDTVVGIEMTETGEG